MGPTAGKRIPLAWPRQAGDYDGRARDCRQALAPLVDDMIEAASGAGWDEAEAAEAILAASADIMLGAARAAVHEKLKMRLPARD